MKEKKWVLKAENFSSYDNVLPQDCPDVLLTEENTVDNPVYFDFALRHVRAVYNIGITAKFYAVNGDTNTAKNISLTIPKPTYYMRFKLYKNDSNNAVFACERYDENGDVLGEVSNATILGSIENTFTLRWVQHSTSVERVDYYEYTDDYEDIPENNDNENLICYSEALTYTNNLGTDLETELNDYSAIPSGTEVKTPYYVRRNTFVSSKPIIKYSYSTNGGSTISTTTKSFLAREFRYYTISYIENSDGVYAVCKTYDKYGEFIDEQQIKLSSNTFANFQIKLVNMLCYDSKTYTHKYIEKSDILIDYAFQTKRNVVQPIDYIFETERKFSFPYVTKTPTYRIASISGYKGTYENLAQRQFKTYGDYTYCEMTRADFIVQKEVSADIKASSEVKANFAIIKPCSVNIKASSKFAIDTRHFIEMPSTAINCKSTVTAKQTVQLISTADINTNSDLEADFDIIETIPLFVDIKTNNSLNLEPTLRQRFNLTVDFISTTTTKAQASVITALEAEIHTKCLFNAPMKKFVRKDNKVITLTITKKYNFTTYIDDEAGLMSYK